MCFGRCCRCFYPGKKDGKISVGKVSPFRSVMARCCGYMIIRQFHDSPHLFHELPQMIRTGAAVRRRTAASVRRQHPVRVYDVTLQTRRQHTQPKDGETKASIHARQYDNEGPTARGRGRSRRAGFVTLAVLGLAGAYGLQQATTAKSTQKSLNKSSFTPFTLIDKEKVSATCSIFTLEQQSPDAAHTIQNMWNKGIWSIDIKQPQLQIARSYTPLPLLKDEHGLDICRLRLMVRREEKGEMSNYIHRTPIGASLEVRGPAVEYALPRSEPVRRIIFLAGGTGIAPALQIAHAMPETEGRMTVLWANRTREECHGGKSDTISSSRWIDGLRNMVGMSSSSMSVRTNNNADSRSSNAIVGQVDEIKSTRPGKLAVDYFVDEEGTFLKPVHVLAAINEFSDNANNSNSGRNVIFVSGPEGFLNYWAGPKEWHNGREVQGPLSGALSRMNLADWEVVKL